MLPIKPDRNLSYFLSWRRVLDGRLFAVAFVEPIDASRRIHQFLLAGEKRMTSGTDFNVQIALFGGASLKSFPTGAGDCNLVICRMNFWFHYSLDPIYR